MREVGFGQRPFCESLHCRNSTQPQLVINLGYVGASQRFGQLKPRRPPHWGFFFAGCSMLAMALWASALLL